MPTERKTLKHVQHAILLPLAVSGLASCQKARLSPAVQADHPRSHPQAPAKRKSAIPKRAPTRQAEPAEFIPPGWKSREQVTGDLNRDGLSDLVLVIRQSDPAKMLDPDENSGGEHSINANPYRLIIALRDPSTMRLASVVRNDALIQPSDNRFVVDHYDGVAIARGIVRINLSYFASAGGWWMQNRTLAFRYQDHTFRLIGIEHSDSNRSSGQYTTTSVNYLSGKVKSESGLQDGSVEGVRWSRLPKRPLIDVAKMGDGLAFPIPDQSEKAAEPGSNAATE